MFAKLLKGGLVACAGAGTAPFPRVLQGSGLPEAAPVKIAPLPWRLL
jgi:hypothetical protein